ncbi:hypothetical protein VTK26DRAFT_4784 [Humicola hyalothermophila]
MERSFEVGQHRIVVLRRRFKSVSHGESCNAAIPLLSRDDVTEDGPPGSSHPSRKLSGSLVACRDPAPCGLAVTLQQSLRAPHPDYTRLQPSCVARGGRLLSCLFVISLSRNCLPPGGGSADTPLQPGLAESNLASYSSWGARQYGSVHYTSQLTNFSLAESSAPSSKQSWTLDRTVRSGADFTRAKTWRADAKRPLARPMVSAMALSTLVLTDQTDNKLTDHDLLDSYCEFAQGIGRTRLIQCPSR